MEYEHEYKDKIDKSPSKFLIPKCLDIYGDQQRGFFEWGGVQEMTSSWSRETYALSTVDIRAAFPHILGEIDTEIALVKNIVKAFVISLYFF